MKYKDALIFETYQVLPDYIAIIVTCKSIDGIMPVDRCYKNPYEQHFSLVATKNGFVRGDGIMNINEKYSFDSVDGFIHFLIPQCAETIARLHLGAYE